MTGSDSSPRETRTWQWIRGPAVPVRRWLHLAVLALLAGLLPGCAPRTTTMHIQQPQLPGFQQSMDLLTETAAWSPAAGFIRVLAEFPLPGARTGEPSYLLYLRLPDAGEPIAVAGETSPTGRGFFIQTRGKFAGLARLNGGQVVVRGSGMERGAHREIRFELTCEDGSALNGTLLAARNDWHLTEFETRRRPGDVAAMKPVYFQPAGSAPAP